MKFLSTSIQFIDKFFGNDPLKRLFTPDARRKITEAVASTKRKTTAEIVVCVLNRCDHDIREHPHSQHLHMQAGREMIQRRLHKTENRMAVLLLVVLEGNAFYILPDVKIHEKFPQEYWESLARELSKTLKEGTYVSAIASAILEVGTILSKDFPRTKGNEPELFDEPIIGNE